MMIEIPLLDAPAARPAVQDISDDASRLLKLLADATRRRIFLLLMQGETCNCEMAQELGLAQNLISHHIRQLREAGFVRERRDEHDARWIYFRLNEDALAAAWRSLDALINPAHLGQRAPICPPDAAP